MSSDMVANSREVQEVEMCAFVDHTQGEAIAMAGVTSSRPLCIGLPKQELALVVPDKQEVLVNISGPFTQCVVALQVFTLQPSGRDQPTSLPFDVA